MTSYFAFLTAVEKDQKNNEDFSALVQVHILRRLTWLNLLTVSFKLKPIFLSVPAASKMTLASKVFKNGSKINDLTS